MFYGRKKNKTWCKNSVLVIVLKCLLVVLALIVICSFYSSLSCTPLKRACAIKRGRVSSMECPCPALAKRNIRLQTGVKSLTLHFLAVPVIMKHEEIWVLGAESQRVQLSIDM